MEVDLHENAERALRMVREAKDLSYDTEGSGLDWRYNSPTGYVIGTHRGWQNGGEIPLCTADDVVYVPVRHGGGGNLLGGRPMQAADEETAVHPFEQALAKAFDDRNRTSMGRTIGHHIKFDAHFSANKGIMLGRRMACTQNTQALLNEYQRSFSLDNCAKEHNVEAKKGEDLYKHMASLFGGPADRNQMGNYWRLSGTDPLGYEYAVGDGVTTMQLYFAQMKQIREEELDVVCELENDLIWTVFRMERTGIPVDINLIGTLRSATEAKISELLRSLPVGFNARSPVQMKQLMDEHGHTDYPTTDLGNPSFTEKWLKTNAIGKTIIEIRQASNLLNSFVNPLAERHVFKGRVHATLNQLKSDSTGTISGRFSCSEPNLQQVPKRVKELAKPFRRLFIADEGWTFWERDWSQCEPRLFAHYSQDPNLLAGYNAVPFVDAHSQTAILLGVERDPTAKRMNMGIFTGMQKNALAGHMNCSVEDAEQYLARWFAAYPTIKNFQYKAKTRLLNRGYVKTILGRRGRLEDRRFAYRAVSKIIQGGNADIMKYVLLKMDRFCEDTGDLSRVLMVVHDSFNGQYQQTPEGKANFEEMIAMMEDVKSPPLNLSVPFVAEGFEGKNWSEASFGPEKAA
jgi:DNA polymerase-1